MISIPLHSVWRLEDDHSVTIEVIAANDHHEVVTIKPLTGGWPYVEPDCGLAVPALLKHYSPVSGVATC